MVPDKFDMVDMGGIDLIESQGVAVTGLYQKLVESIALCRYQCLYNWKFNGILIPPSYVEMVVRDGSVWINEGVSVDEEDVVHIYAIEPEPPAPVLPVIAALEVSANGVYQAPESVDGYNPVTVNVPSSGVNMIELDREPTAQDGNVGDYCISTVVFEADGFCLKITRVARGSNTNFTYWGTSAFRVALENENEVEVNITELQNYSIWLSPTDILNNTATQNQLFTNPVSASYVERNPLPGYIAIAADNIFDYTLKSFSFCRRQGSVYIDYCVDFDVFWFKDGIISSDPIFRARNLTQQDWPDGELVEFTVNKKPEEKKLFYKTESGWIQII